MHPRSSTPAAAVASISVLMLAGCGSGKSTAAATTSVTSSSSSSAGTAVTTATTAPTVPAATPTKTPTPSSAAGRPTTPQTPGTPSTSDAGPVLGGGDSCAAVDVRLERLPGVASGTTFFDLIVTNHGSHNCTLPAQPKLTFLGATHKPVQVTFSSDSGAPTFLLGPNLSAAMSVGYSSVSQPPCDAKIAWVQVTSPAHDVPFDGRTHCQTDTYHENHWMPGTYAQPQ
jgi:hypothetical protein